MIKQIKPLPKKEKTQWELNKEGTAARTKLTHTREKTARLLLAKAREDLIDKDLVIKQATYLFVAMRQKMLGAPLSYHRRFLHLSDPHKAIDLLTGMMHDLLRELKEMPRKIVDPNWMETLDDD